MPVKLVSQAKPYKLIIKTSHLVSWSVSQSAVLVSQTSHLTSWSMILVNQSVRASYSQISLLIKSVTQVNKSSIQPIRSFTSLFVACQLVSSASLVSLSISQSVTQPCKWVSQSGHSAMQLGQSVKSSQLTRFNQLVSQSVKVSVNQLSIKYFGWSIIVRLSNQGRLTGR